jgi:hypothetical protein
MLNSAKFTSKLISTLLPTVLAVAALTLSTAPAVYAVEEGHGNASGHHTDEGGSKGKGHMGGKEGESHGTSHGGASETTEDKVMSGRRSVGGRISGKGLARLNAARVFMTTGITKTDAIYEDEAPLSKIYNYQQILLANPDLNTTELVSAAAFNLARVATIPISEQTLTKLDTFLGTTFNSTYNWSTGGAAVESALETTTLAVLGQTVDIAQPTSFIDAVNLLQKALKTEEEDH